MEFKPKEYEGTLSTGDMEGVFFRLYRAIEQDYTFSTKIGLKTIVYPDSV